MEMKKLISWNVNGLRACVGKGFLDFFKKADADVFCIQESKLQEGQIDLDLPGYFQYWNYAEKKGYSGTALFAREEPLSVAYGLGIEEHDHEGRVITAEFEEYYVVTCYTPNSQDGLARLDYRMEWEFTELLNAGFIDTWRYFHPDTEGVYSWWSYRFKAREKNAGWRIDYFCVSEALKERLVSAGIHTEVLGSDHCPVELMIRQADEGQG